MPATHVVRRAMHLVTFPLLLLFASPRPLSFFWRFPVRPWNAAIGLLGTGFRARPTWEDVDNIWSQAFFLALFCVYPVGGDRVGQQEEMKMCEAFSPFLNTKTANRENHSFLIEKGKIDVVRIVRLEDGADFMAQFPCLSDSKFSNKELFALRPDNRKLYCSGTGKFVMKT